jgi:hypothetical protein
MTFSSFRSRRSQHSRKPKVLKGKDIPSLAEYIKSEDCKNVILMVRGDFSLPTTAAALIVIIKKNSYISDSEFSWALVGLFRVMHEARYYTDFFVFPDHFAGQ